MPGIIIFNQSHAIFTPLYLAIRLLVASSSITPESLFVRRTDLAVIPWSFGLGYVLPLTAMALPGISVRGINTKHTLASWYQQWNLYIYGCHLALVAWNSSGDTAVKDESTSMLTSVRPVYILTLVMAAAAFWTPILVSSFATLIPEALGRGRSSQLRFSKVLLPPSPWRKIKCADIFQGGNWLIQWDGLIGGLGTSIWATALYIEARASISPHENLSSLLWRVLGYALLGGNMGVAAGMLWERDTLVLV